MLRFCGRRAGSDFRQAAVLCLLMMLCLPAVKTAAATVFRTVDTPSEGCSLVMVEGNYNADTQAALNRINEIRLEACREGVWDPRDSSRQLTEADYVPIQWSSSLEYIARVRAAEASLVVSHDRPNGYRCFSVSAPDGSSSNGEVLAWNWSSTMVSGIEQWYGEKSAWVNRVSGAVTGHYTQMIDPDHTFVGLASFNYSDGVYYNTVSGEFTYGSGHNTQMAGAVQDCQVIIEIRNSALSDVVLRKVDEDVQNYGALDKGDKVRYALSILTTLEGRSAYVRDIGTVQWNSSNTGIAQVTQAGVATITGVGSVTITASSTTGRQGSIELTPAHAPSGWKVDKTAGFTEDGREIITCGYCGEVLETRTISHIKEITLTPNTFDYNGMYRIPEVVVKDAQGNTLSESDYSCRFDNNLDPGTATARITGCGRYEGTKDVSYTIKQIPISNAWIETITSRTYTGKEIKPVPYVYFNGSYLTSGTDFTLSYKNNIKVGKATVTVTGKGKYTGSKSVNFTIDPKPAAPSAGSGSSTSGSSTSGSSTSGSSGQGSAYQSQAKGFRLMDFWNNRYFQVTKAGASGKAEVAFTGQVYGSSEAVIPSAVVYAGVTYKVTSIAAKAFKGNTSLQKVTIGKNVTTIGAEAFSGCKALKKVVIPAKVKKIGKKAFYGAKKLKTIQIKTKKLTASRIGAKAFSGIYKKAVFKLPSAKKKAYKKLLLKKGAKKTMKYKS